MTRDDDIATLRRMAGLATPMALRTAVTLGLPDRLSAADAGTIDTPTLAAELDVSPVALGLLLGHLMTLGVLERTATGHRTTAFGANLRSDAGNLLPLLLHTGTAAGRAELAFVELGYSVRTGRAAYPQRYGRDFWSDLDGSAALRESLNDERCLLELRPGS